MLLNSKNIVLLSNNKENRRKVEQVLTEVFNYGRIDFGYNDIHNSHGLIKEVIMEQPDKLFTGKMLFVFNSPVYLEEFKQWNSKIQQALEQFPTEKGFKFLYITDQSNTEEKEDVINIKGLNTNEIFFLIADRYRNEINIYTSRKILSLYYLGNELE